MSACSLPLPPETLSDGPVTLRLTGTSDADPAHGIVPSYQFEIMRAQPSGSVSAGRLQLRVGPDESLYFAGHIGYYIHGAQRGRRFAYHATRAVLPFAASLGMSHLLITCDPDNIASRRTIQRLGATLLETCMVPEDMRGQAGGSAVKCIFSLSLAGIRDA